MACIFLAWTLHASALPVPSIHIALPPEPGTGAEDAGRILARQITDRCEAAFTNAAAANLQIGLSVDPAIGVEGYRIGDSPGGGIRIAGGDKRGLIYGVGKFLRTSRYDGGGFTPGSWRGSARPASPVRGIYFATHFGNYYEEAPIEAVRGYLDELALWGVNHLQVTFPRWHFQGFDDPAAAKALGRLRELMHGAKLAGLKVSLIAGNDGFKSTPREFLRVPVPDPLHRRGDFGVNLCPSHPGAHALLLKDWGRLMDEFAGIGLDAVEFWPYDEGGCGCTNCWPWGARGFPTLGRDLSRIARDRYPGIQVVLSTWTFDTPPVGEWDGLSRFLATDTSWANYILADAHEDFPRYPIDRGVPGGLPLLNFPEISMWGQHPWGGYGANPLPERLQGLWNQTQRKLSGGFPYSEGIYEDLNKAICSQLYWDGNRSTTETVREYVAYEFSPDIVEPVARAITLLEANHQRNKIGPQAREAFRLLDESANKMTPRARKAWRWRILYLRALIDRELLDTQGQLRGETLKKAFEELTSIYHAERAHSMPIHPPVIPGPQNGKP
ncbi:MAG: hypothetical protein DVB31_09870 [Verrucomicrobia bacterium]|nr:MAG: hypothetical protein DVB31_09870 [Verrucomicrobiota bacterium]